MMWFYLSILGYAILAVVSIMDKFLLSEAKLSSPLYVFYSTVFLLPIFLLVPFGVTYPQLGWDWFLIILSGFSFGFGLYGAFVGFEQSEVSHIGPLIGAAIPLFTLFLSRYFLGEILSGKTLLAVCFLIVGSLIVSFEKSKLHNGWHKGVWFGLLSGLLFAISNVSSKYIYDIYGFFSGFVWTRGAIGIFGILIFFHPAVYAKLFHQTWWTKIKNKLVVKNQQNSLSVVVVDKILGMTGVLFIQYAIAIGSVTLVNALTGLQYAFLIILVFILTKFWPRTFREDYAKGEIFQELVAIFIIVIGLMLLV